LAFAKGLLRIRYPKELPKNFPNIMSKTTPKDFSKGVRVKKLRGDGLRIAIVYARWNEKIISAMKKGAEKILLENSVAPTNIVYYEVPGAYELPFACKSIIEKSRNTKDAVDAVIALGCLIKGETMHFEYICNAVSAGLNQVGLTTGIPVIFGVLTVLNDEQALARAGLTLNGHNHGEDYGYAAIEMARYGGFKPSKL
jgi:6,7-dimethyl-8-ribityllumazine synthase